MRIIKLSNIEQWRSVPSEPGYEVSNFGRARSCNRFIYCMWKDKVPYKRFCKGRLLRPSMSAGYCNITDNAQDRVRNGKTYRPKGELHHNAKLTDDQVRQLRRVYKRYGTKHIKLAKEFGIGSRYACAIGKGEGWLHVV